MSDFEDMNDAMADADAIFEDRLSEFDSSDEHIPEEFREEYPDDPSDEFESDPLEPIAADEFDAAFPCEDEDDVLDRLSGAEEDIMDYELKLIHRERFPFDE